MNKKLFIEAITYIALIFGLISAHGTFKIMVNDKNQFYEENKKQIVQQYKPNSLTHRNLMEIYTLCDKNSNGFNNLDCLNIATVVLQGTPGLDVAIRDFLAIPETHYKWNEQPFNASLFFSGFQYTLNSIKQRILAE